MEYMVDVAKLKVEMASNQMNIVKLAKACDVHPITISRLINGAFPTYSLMQKITKALKLSPLKAMNIFFAHNLRKT